MNRLIFALVCTFAAGTSACATSATTPITDSNGTSPSSAPDPKAFCSAYCHDVASCDKTSDELTCTNACENRYAATFPKIREDVAQALGDCISEKDCKSLLGSDVVTVCANEVAAASAPSSAATSFCVALGATKTKCGVTADKAACLTMAKLYGDDALAEGNVCASKACADVDACVAAALGSLEGSPSTSTSPPSTTTTSCSSISHGSSQCKSCYADSCCAQASACASDSSCNAMWSCIEKCGSSSSSSSQCMSSCAPANSAAVSKYQALATCTSTSCGGLVCY